MAATATPKPTKASEQDTEQTTDAPAAYPPGTLFVAVNDGIQVYAGDDGGPAKGGKGRWRVGEVGPWTAVSAPPIAHRNPEDGLIWKGWLEEVETTRLDASGNTICVKSKKVFSEPLAMAQRSTARAAKAGQMIPKPKKPSAKAQKRATLGAAPMADALKPVNQRAEQLADAGIPVDTGGDAPPAAPARASDRPVG